MDATLDAVKCEIGCAVIADLVGKLAVYPCEYSIRNDFTSPLGKCSTVSYQHSKASDLECVCRALLRAHQAKFPSRS